MLFLTAVNALISFRLAVLRQDSILSDTAAPFPINNLTMYGSKRISGQVQVSVQRHSLIHNETLVCNYSEIDTNEFKHRR